MRKEKLGFGIALVLLGVGSWFFLTRSEVDQKATLSAQKPESEVSAFPAPSPSSDFSRISSGTGSGVAARNEPKNKGQFQRSPAQLKLEEYVALTFPQKPPAKWGFERDENGNVMSILGGLIPEGGKNVEEAAGLARKFAPFFGVEPDQIHAEGARVDAGPRATTYDFPQYAQGYAVFDSRMTILSRNSDGAVYMINSDLKPAEPVKTENVLGAEEAKRLLQSRYADRELKSIRVEPSLPVVWANSKPNELAWVFIVDIRGVPATATHPGKDPDRLQVVVGAQSSAVLLERTMIVH